MTNDSIAKQIAEFLTKKLEEDVSPTNRGALLVEDYDADSMDIMEIADFLEDTFEIKVPNGDIKAIRSFGDVVDYVTQRI